MNDTELRLRVAMEAAAMAIWDSTVVGGRIWDGLINWSAAGAALIGREPIAFIQPYVRFLNQVAAADRERVLAIMQAGVDRRDGYELEYCIERQDGALHWLAAKAQIICDETGAPIRTLGMVWDITPRVVRAAQAHENDHLAEITLCAISDGVIRTDRSGRVTFINRAAEALTGWTSSSAHGLDIETVMPLIHSNDDTMPEHVMKRSIQQKQTIGVHPHAQLITREGKRIDIEDAAAPIRGPEGVILGAVNVFRDVSHERRLTAQLSWQATHDVLTGLINRVEFETRVAAAFHLAKEEGQVHALLYMDLDRFKVVNDTCGHAAGDVLLKLITKMLHEQMRESDVLARLGGDELGALLVQCPLERASTIAEELRRAVSAFRFTWDQRTFELGISIGIVEINEDSVSMTELLIAADQACYLAKKLGRNRINIYREADALLEQQRGEMKWLARLHEAFDKRLFQLHAMPIVSLRDANDRHDEILIRMVNKGGDLIMPGAFIPAAERYDMMYQIDQWVIAETCAYIAAQAGQRDPAPDHLPADHDGVRYSINLSGASLNEPKFCDYIVQQFTDHGISPEQVCFEITETAVIANLPKAQLFIRNLKAIGCRFSLDDFGSGLSSFSYLKTLPVDYLKIDGIFVKDIATNPTNFAMVRAINDVGHVMNIKTVAEFVEDEQALQSVRDLGIDYAQGYAIGGVHLLSAAPRPDPHQASPG